MSKIEFTYPPGAIPLDPNKTQGLIPDYISNQGELNLLEKDNILDAVSWANGLLHDTKYWVEHKIYPWDELATRFHHRLVVIHAFANGNKRHARLMTNQIYSSLLALFSFTRRLSRLAQLS